MKKLFLIPLIALSFSQNVKADCLGDYDSALLELNKHDKDMEGWGFVTISVGSFLGGLVSSADIPQAGATTTGVGIGAGALLSGLTSLTELKQMITILKEARLGNGLELISLRNEITSSNPEKSEKETVASLAKRINELNDSGVLCASKDSLVDRNGLMTLLSE